MERRRREPYPVSDRSLVKPCRLCGTPFGPGKTLQAFKRKKYCSTACRYQAMRSDESAFWNKVIKGPGCWEWKGAHIPDGYAWMTWKRRQMGAHRVSWMLNHGPIPPGAHVLHKCDNRGCVRPDHLQLGTHKDNMADMGRKKRGTCGEKNYNAKLTADQVRAIRNSYCGGKGRRSNAKEIAALFGVEVGAVHSVVAGRTWTHIK